MILGHGHDVDADDNIAIVASSSDGSVRAAASAVAWSLPSPCGRRRVARVPESMSRVGGEASRAATSLISHTFILSYSRTLILS